MEKVEVVVAHDERATLRVGDVFLKIDADPTRTDVEVEAMAMVPIPTPEVLWRSESRSSMPPVWLEGTYGWRWRPSRSGSRRCRGVTPSKG